MKFLFIIICVFGVSISHAESSNINYPEVEPQASFQSITALANKQPDLKVNYGDLPLQFGWLWKPEQSSEEPLLVMVHGGCWLNAFDVSHTFPMVTALAQHGYPVWSLEYRRTGDEGGGWPGSFDDIKQAVDYIPELQKHGIDTEEPIIIGHSAGGHLALLAASESNQITFKKIIGLAAITDISRYAQGENGCQKATPQFMNGLPFEQAEAYQQASLVYRKLPENTLLLHGKADQIVPVIQAQIKGVETIWEENAGHFDWIHPGTSAFAELLQQLSAIKTGNYHPKSTPHE